MEGAFNYRRAPDYTDTAGDTELSYCVVGPREVIKTIPIRKAKYKKKQKAVAAKILLNTKNTQEA